ncbi:MAG: carboxylesterase family protein, partial [Bacteroidetes bacterium]|nr:carboxylesterase family protein [Bacteroidota bacterium]
MKNPVLRLLLVTCIAIGILLPGYSQVKKVPIVRTENGLVSGTGSADGKVQVFKGIPFAAPPVGDLRWKAPQPAKNWDSVRACTKFPPSAMQPVPEPFFVWSEEFMAPKEPLSEDCLYLNVWTPANYEAKNLPVIVWVHGGGFMAGAGSCPIYDGEGMAEKGVVFISINYRLGVFGFLAHPELSAESGQGSGNYAFLDQLAALRWVQRNIAAFGGDPNRVTVAGQSAGAFSVNALVASPLAKGLFRRAIAESGGMFSGDRAKPLAVAEQEGVEFFKKSGAADLAGLRKLPADYLLKQLPVNSPVIDGYVLPTDVATIFSEGKQNDVPVLTGWNSGDGFLFGKAPTADEFQQQVKSRYGKFSEKFLKFFPAAGDQEAEKSQIRLNRDLIFAWQSHLWATMQRKTGQSKIWLYQFDRVPPGRPDLEKHGAFHSAEIAYALNALPMWRRPWEAADRELSALMSGYWVNFAASGDPNTDSLP